ncbi:hypothetical protein CSH63_18475 [Micromonospora tulbaghiae]|uniref:Uncharacterized protein n=1 Tax=Micromonospora tulbaghiae TaxID=479978 RepID=A0A386WM33_9ACTN|nr:hypothetical protein [Micromonospora tulbaghiae]AYF29416.1 hypothetical protein CSH63_18475 [Micromonospora tulbaghiae]
MQISATRQWTEPAQVHNLTVDDIHTYYVIAGDAPVLVHNCGGDIPAPSMADKPLGSERPDANPLEGTRYTEKVQEQIKSGDDHAFPASIDTLPTMRDTSMVKGGDGIPRLHVKLPGSVNGSRGTFHWIIEPDGSISYRFFDRRMK